MSKIEEYLGEKDKSVPIKSFVDNR